MTIPEASGVTSLTSAQLIDFFASHAKCITLSSKQQS
jgi:hypothetical protein